MLAAIPLALHLIALTNYGFFRDELYFIVCGRHPAFGYVDGPPLVPLLAAASQSAGESLWLMRIAPALFHVGAVLAACAVARELGGGRGAALVAGLATGTAPVLLSRTATLGPSALEPLTWTLLAYCAARAVLRREPRWWIVAGIVAGFASEDTYTIAFLLIALVIGLAVASPRRTFAQPEFWLGCVVTVVIASPSIVWQAVHGWPVLELVAAGAAGKNIALAPLPWILEQVTIVNPAFAPIWFAGIAALIITTRTRFLGLTVLTLFATSMTLQAKDDYLAALYPLLFAAGAVALERFVRNAFVRTAYVVLATLGALLLAPLALPVFPEPTLVNYARAMRAALHIGQTENEHHRAGVLPQNFADMHGWREIADRAGAAERSLSPAERAQAAVFAQNYGEAAAVDVFGDGTLPVISGHNSYYLWGPHGAHDVVIIIGGEKRDAERVFRNVVLVQTVRTSYAMPYENNLPIYIARDPKIDLTRLWPNLKHFD